MVMKRTITYRPFRIFGFSNPLRMIVFGIYLRDDDIREHIEHDTRVEDIRYVLARRSHFSTHIRALLDRRVPIIHQPIV